MSPCVERGIAGIRKLPPPTLAAPLEIVYLHTMPFSFVHVSTADAVRQHSIDRPIATITICFMFCFHYHPIGGTESFLLNGAYNTITQLSRQ